MKKFFKTLLQIIVINVLSAVSAYAVYILLLVTGVIHYYDFEFADTAANLPCYITLAVSFIGFLILYSVTAIKLKKSRRRLDK